VQLSRRQKRGSLSGCLLSHGTRNAQVQLFHNRTCLPATARARLLHGWARHAPVRAEHAAITRPGPHDSPTARARPEEGAGVHRHLLLCRRPAAGARENRFECRGHATGESGVLIGPCVPHVDAARPAVLPQRWPKSSMLPGPKAPSHSKQSIKVGYCAHPLLSAFEFHGNDHSSRRGMPMTGARQLGE